MKEISEVEFAAVLRFFLCHGTLLSNGVTRFGGFLLFKCDNYYILTSGTNFILKVIYMHDEPEIVQSQFISGRIEDLKRFIGLNSSTFTAEKVIDKA